MTRVLPHPILSVSLVFVWLLLNRFSLGHLVLGTGIAVVAGWALGALEPQRLRLRNPRAMVKLFFIVGYDIIRSNIAVAVLILTGGRHGQRHSAFIRVPLRLRSEAALAVLAIIMTATPGTAWLEYDPDSGVLLLHVFDMREGDDWVRLIGDRYESLLLEIFP